jgi:glycosyltransferase involved in cell wall biosynthesis
MIDMADKAAALEPLIRRPYGDRKLTWPPYAHDCRRLFRLARRLQSVAAGHEAETIMLLPHLRQMSGASYCGAEMARAIHGIFPEERVLLVLTDVEGEKAPPWLDPGLDVLDFAAIAGKGVNRNFRERLLLDLISGLRARRIINVNSRLGWDVFMQYGLQLHSWADTYAYLFCWDLDEDGVKAGYPVRELQAAFNNLSGVFTDSEALRGEIIGRYVLPDIWKNRLHALHTPAPDSMHGNCRDSGKTAAAGRPLRALWAGRLDRQKRPDIAMDVMRELPDMELWLYGKPVFGKSGINMRNLPRNVLYKGVYDRFDDLPLKDFDLFLNTSEWDGLPNVLIQAAACGMPVVSSLSGGIGELLDEETGWPVRDHLNPAAYAARIREVADNPAEAARRSRKLEKKTRELCNRTRYAQDIAAALRSGQAQDS